MCGNYEGDGVELFRRELLRSGAFVGWTAGLGVGATGIARGSHSRGMATELTRNDEPAFQDDFEDGDYTEAPAWTIAKNSDETFDASVVDTATPFGGSKALSVGMTDASTPEDNSGFIGWKDGVRGWDGEWTLSGAFYTAELSKSAPFVGHFLSLFPKASTSSQLNFKIRLGFSTPVNETETLPLAIRGPLVDSVESTHDPGWQENTWYRYEISHDGSGTYTGRIWESGDERPASPQAKSVGQPPGTEAYVGGILIQSPNDVDIQHDFIRFELSSGEDLQPLVDEKLSLIERIRSITDSDPYTVSEFESTENIEEGEEVVGFLTDRRNSIDSDAQSLVNEFADKAGDVQPEKREQFRRALNRLTSIESITKTAALQGIPIARELGEFESEFRIGLASLSLGTVAGRAGGTAADVLEFLSGVLGSSIIQDMLEFIGQLLDRALSLFGTPATNSQVLAGELADMFPQDRRESVGESVKTGVQDSADQNGWDLSPSNIVNFNPNGNVDAIQLTGTGEQVMQTAVSSGKEADEGFFEELADYSEDVAEGQAKKAYEDFLFNDPGTSITASEGPNFEGERSEQKHGLDTAVDKMVAEIEARVEDGTIDPPAIGDESDAIQRISRQTRLALNGNKTARAAIDLFSLIEVIALLLAVLAAAGIITSIGAPLLLLLAAVFGGLIIATAFLTAISGRNDLKAIAKIHAGMGYNIATNDGGGS